MKHASKIEYTSDYRDQKRGRAARGAKKNGLHVLVEKEKEEKKMGKKER